MSRRPIDRDTVSGIATYFHYDEANDSFHIESVQDIEPILEANRREFNEYTSGRDKWGDHQKIAHIPNVVLSELMASGKLWDKVYMRKWLNDPANSPYRTRPGRI